MAGIVAMDDDTQAGSVTLGEVYRLVKKIDRTLNGNGQEGIIVKIERHNAYFRLVGGVLAGIVAALGTHIASVAKLF